MINTAFSLKNGQKSKLIVNFKGEKTIFPHIQKLGPFWISPWTILGTFLGRNKIGLRNQEKESMLNLENEKNVWK